jgi:hypothetical protein
MPSAPQTGDGRPPHRALSLSAEQYRDALVVVPALLGAEPNLHGEILLFMGIVLGRVERMEEALAARA